MFSQDEDDSQQRLVLGVVFGLIALVVALVIGVATYTKNQAMAGASPAASAAISGASGAVASVDADADKTSVKVENGVVKFYFAVGKAELATGANEALAEVVKAVAAGKTVLVSGYHDASGDPVKNAELAKQRANTVRTALIQLGVADGKVELKRPEQALADGKPSEARRVEVVAK
jgi:outer membrane protein OmpA-like peptidoglycan-associated protein